MRRTFCLKKKKVQFFGGFFEVLNKLSSLTCFVKDRNVSEFAVICAELNYLLYSNSDVLIQPKTAILLTNFVFLASLHTYSLFKTFLYSLQSHFQTLTFPSFCRPGLMWLGLLKWFEDIVLLTQPPHHVIVLSTDLSSGVVVSVGEWMLCFVMGRGRAAETSLLRINGLFWAADTILQSAESVCLVKIKGSLENHIVCLQHKDRAFTHWPSFIKWV